MNGEELDPAVVVEMLRRSASGRVGPTINDLRSKNPTLLRPEQEMRRWRRTLFDTLASAPPTSCMAQVTPRCSGVPIRSHSIQRKRTLEPLAEGTGHVVTFKLEGDPDERPIAVAVPTGIKRHASIFFGLCGPHDSSIFADIDTGLTCRPTKLQLLRIAYRSVLREEWAKARAAYHHRELASKAQKDAGTSNEAKTVALLHAYSTYEGRHALAVRRADLGRRLASGRVGTDLVLLHRVVGRPAFAASGVFTPTHDERGRRVRSRRGKLPWATLDVSFLDSERALVSAVYPSIYADSSGSQLRHAFRTRDRERFLERVWEIVLRNIENLAISPSGWDAFSLDEQGATLDFFHRTVFNEWTSWPGLTAPI